MTQEEYEDIAKRLIDLRKNAGYSQEDLAAKLFVSRQAVSKWERAEALPDTENLIALASLYGVSLDSIVRASAPAQDESATSEPEPEEPAQEQSAQDEQPSENEQDEQDRSKRIKE
jgi:transcriptional regulator with XRE-family HTH domain